MVPADDPAPALPEAVRRQVLDLAAAVLGSLPAAEVPGPLRRVRDFAPARRATAGGGPLLAALDGNVVFRHLVAAAWRERHPDLAADVDRGAGDDAEQPGAPDLPETVAGLYLVRPDGWLDRVAAASALSADTEREAGGDQEVAAAPGRDQRLRERLAEREAELELARAELAAVRRDLRRHRSDADRARAQARAAELLVEQERELAVRAVHEAGAEVAELTAKLREAEHQLEGSRRVARAGRDLAEARLRLLLDTILGAATGLRRELALAPLTVRPADLVGGTDLPAAPEHADSGPDGASSPWMPSDAQVRQGRADGDPGLLADLLVMPESHLIVDGYNVTLTGYPNLPLAEQRRRLVESLAALGARTAAEVTCCFDGAEPDDVARAGRGAVRVRGVRVLFSEPGSTADALIGRLVRAEPPGRCVVVVSSDAEVAGAARRAGAWPVASDALLRLTARG